MVPQHQLSLLMQCLVYRIQGLNASGILPLEPVEPKQSSCCWPCRQQMYGNPVCFAACYPECPKRLWSFLFCRKQWGALFSTDPELAALIAQTLTVLAFYIPLDGLSVVLGGVIRGAGKQLLAAPCVIVSYYALGLPAAAYFAFNLGFGVRGLCLGTLLGTAAHAGSFYFLVWKLDWNLEAHRAAARVKGQKAVALQTILTPSSDYDDCGQDVAEVYGEKPDFGSDLLFEAEEGDERAGLLAGMIANSVLSVRSDSISFAEGSEPDGQGSLAK